MGDEMTFFEWMDSKWGKLAWKAAVIVSPLIFSAGLWVLNDIRSEAASAREAAAVVQSKVAEVNSTQQERADIADDRAKAADAFQVYVKGEIADVKEGQQRTVETIGSVQVSVARLLGMVEQMQRQQDLASLPSRPR